MNTKELTSGLAKTKARKNIFLKSEPSLEFHGNIQQIFKFSRKCVIVQAITVQGGAHLSACFAKNLHMSSM
jgi:hypothetical protein